MDKYSKNYYDHLDEVEQNFKNKTNLRGKCNWTPQLPKNDEYWEKLLEEELNQRRIEKENEENRNEPSKRGDWNGDKEINPKYEGNEEQKEKVNKSMENGYSEEQAKAVPNDTLVKEGEDADIKTKDGSKENLEKIKVGDPTASVEEGSDFKISEEIAEEYGISPEEVKIIEEYIKTGKMTEENKSIIEKYYNLLQELENKED